MPDGLCALCCQARDLRVSHLLPKALYRLARDRVPAEGIGPDPLQITRETTIQTSAQITCRLLCDECEQRFSRNGEKVVIKECCRTKGEFILREKLRAETPFLTQGTWACFSGSRVTS